MIIKDSSQFNTKRTITIDDVLNFIDENYLEYDYTIQKALDSKINNGIPVEEIINNRKDMYERLSKLWLH